MLKRLIEVALPLKEVSEQSAREKSIRHGHISTLHIWWARRPLAACRAVVFASLIPDPDDPECPPQFRKLVMEVLNRNEFKPKNGDGSTVEDTPRNRCLEFIKYLVRWENSNKTEYIEPARTLIAAAHKFLHPDAEGDAPKVLDPFAGGGAIPLEALRLGCEAHAIDLNPVAHLIQLCTLVYPQKYGQPDSRPVPDYIIRLPCNHKGHQEHKGLFDDDSPAPADLGALCDLRGCKITEAEYRKNPLAADVKYWGHWVLEQARREIGQFYPSDTDGSIPVAYLWARTVKCPNPQCGTLVPLIRQLWLCNRPNREVALRMIFDRKEMRCRFEIAENKEITFDANKGTMQQGKAACPFCETVIDGKTLRSESKAMRMGQQLMAVVTTKPAQSGKRYRGASEVDMAVYKQAGARFEEEKEGRGKDAVPTELIPLYDPRRVSPPLYGLSKFSDLFNARQLLTHAAFVRHIRATCDHIHDLCDAEYAQVITCYLAVCFDQSLSFSTSLNRWKSDAEAIVDMWGRQAIPMLWDYCENVITGDHGGTWEYRLHRFLQPVEGICSVLQPAVVSHGNAMQLPIENACLEAIITDPPYYDAVPYSALSDFFYVWLKRIVGRTLPGPFSTPFTPKTLELIEQRSHRSLKERKDKAYYEDGMSKAFCEAHRCLLADGICCVMFAHKATSAWETLISGLLRSGLIVTSSWPLHTEMKTRMVAQGTAALASSVTLICRKRDQTAGTGLWDDVRQEVKTVAQERLDFFWNQGIRGADFFISAIGPALSVFGKYERVTKLSGEEVTVGQFLDEVRSLVTSYALAKILKTTHTGTIDPESRFYVVWKWSYADAKVPADESFKLSQALGLNSETLWDKTGVLEKAGENVQATPVSKRIKIKNLGEPTADGAPASLIDVLHRMCAFREKNETPGMVEFLGRSGQANNHSLWLVAQAVSEILPDGEKEKQLMQGLLNQRDMLEEAGREKRLF